MSNARTLASTINSSSEIVVPSGGINFGTSTDGTGTVTPTVGGILDDYEIGTFTATLGYGPNTITSVTGNYTKIGNLVRIDCGFTNISSVSGQTPYIAGFPFSKDSSTCIGSIWSKSFFASGTIHTPTFSGTNTVQFSLDDSFANATMSGSTGTYLVVSVIYITSS